MVYMPPTLVQVHLLAVVAVAKPILMPEQAVQGAMRVFLQALYLKVMLLLLLAAVVAVLLIPLRVAAAAVLQVGHQATHPVGGGQVLVNQQAVRVRVGGPKMVAHCKAALEQAAVRVEAAAILVEAGDRARVRAAAVAVLVTLGAYLVVQLVRVTGMEIPATPPISPLT